MEKESDSVSSADSSDYSDSENRDPSSQLPEEFKCPLCSSVFKHASSLSRHVKSKCGKVKKYSCSGCGKRFDRSDFLMTRWDSEEHL